jgi:hypothetical protein
VTLANSLTVALKTRSHEHLLVAFSFCGNIALLFRSLFTFIEEVR